MRSSISMAILTSREFRRLGRRSREPTGRDFFFLMSLTFSLLFQQKTCHESE